MEKLPIRISSIYIDQEDQVLLIPTAVTNFFPPIHDDAHCLVQS
jgi:hypothetical protein